MEKIVSVWRMVTIALSSMCVRRNMAGKKLGTAVVFQYATILETGCQTWSLTLYIFNCITDSGAWEDLAEVRVQVEYFCR